VWGDDDDLGTLNLLTDARTLAAAAEVRRGAVFPLGLPLDQPGEGMAWRTPVRHHLLRVGHQRRGHRPGGADDPLGAADSGADGDGRADGDAGADGDARADSHARADGDARADGHARADGDSYADRDDYLDGLWLQGSSQWDGLAHVRHRRFGNYNGVADADIHDGPGGRLGIDRWARRGIVGRGLLVDLRGYYAATGVDYDVRAAYAITLTTCVAPWPARAARSAPATSWCCTPGGRSTTSTPPPLRASR
jgi:hypothetical protein